MGHHAGEVLPWRGAGWTVLTEIGFGRLGVLDNPVLLSYRHDIEASEHSEASKSVTRLARCLKIRGIPGHNILRGRSAPSNRLEPPTPEFPHHETAQNHPQGRRAVLPVPGRRPGRLSDKLRVTPGAYMA